MPAFRTKLVCVCVYVLHLFKQLTLCRWSGESDLTWHRIADVCRLSHSRKARLECSGIPPAQNYKTRVASVLFMSTFPGDQACCWSRRTHLFHFHIRLGISCVKRDLSHDAQFSVTQAWYRSSRLDLFAPNQIPLTSLKDPLLAEAHFPKHNWEALRPFLLNIHLHNLHLLVSLLQLR